jgi:hypothetical protein
MIQRIWVFTMRIPGNASQMASFIGRIRGLGVSAVALMINSLRDRSFGLLASRGRAVEEAARQLPAVRVDLHRGNRLRPTERYLPGVAFGGNFF